MDTEYKLFDKTITLIPKFITFFVTLFTINSYSQLRCVNLFELKSQHNDSFHTVKTLDEAFVLFSKIINKEVIPNRKEINKLIADISLKAESYLESEGLSFKKVKGKISIKNKYLDRSQDFYYPIYILSGFNSRSRLSSLLFGAQILAAKKDKKLTVKFDPLLNIKEPNSYGFMNLNSKEIYIGTNSVYFDAIGLSFTLRHEIQHYFESIKISEAEMSLARLQLHHPDNIEDWSYAKFMRFDELESHIRDLREILNQNYITNLDHRILKFTQDRNNIDRIKLNRQEVTFTLIETIEKIIQNSKKILTDIKKNPYNITLLKSKKRIEVVFTTTTPPYISLKINTENLFKMSESNDVIQKLVLNSLNQVLSWSHQRINDLESELQVLKLKAQHQSH